MVYKKLSPNLIVDDVDETLRFYRDVLKFNLMMSVPAEEPFVWVAMARNDVEVMIQARKSASRVIPLFENKEAGGSLMLYIEMEDVMELYDSIKTQVTLIEDLHTKPYGMREFSIQDNNGFVLTFAQRIQEFDEED